MIRWIWPKSCVRRSLVFSLVFWLIWVPLNWPSQILKDPIRILKEDLEPEQF